mmetsp:Transcript_13287/g.23769  ORF Transcript_13287/g.23769 Transcript_13287/m.23769 type:complete len:643 (+) Transcript_13287:52-1980(+)
MACMEGIRPALPQDFSNILHIARLVAEESDAYTWDETATDEELSLSWLPELESLVETFVLEVDGIHGLAGVYVLHPASAGRGGHIAHGLYMVSPVARNRGLGKLLCAHSVREANKRGYSGMRINSVVSTNGAAIRVCAACGFRILCTIPRSFQYPGRGLVDTHVMFHDLDAIEVPAATTRSLTAAEKPALVYPAAPGGVIFSVGEEVQLQPKLGGGTAVGGVSFTVEPALPQGLRLDKAAGTVLGSPVEPLDETRYRITATVSTEIVLRVEEPPTEASPEKFSINEDLATYIENVTKIEDLLLHQPSKFGAFGDWMIWMVHRAWLNDPSLEDFNFNNMHMPPPHYEKRIAPKLMAAMGWNTHIQILSLSNSNVQKVQAIELAASLRKNRTLKTLNLECNSLDSNSVRELALALKDNPDYIEHLQFSHQKQMMGGFFGRPTEEAVAQMMNSNNLIVKLGFECDDAHWRNIIDRALLRNNDYWRRRQAPASVEELPPAEERSLGHILLTAPPQGPANEAFSRSAVFCGFVEQNLKLPTTVQLQNCAKNIGTPLSYTVAAPLIKECRAWMLDAATGKEVVVSDAFGMEVSGVLRQWSENNDNWMVDIWLADGRRSTFRSSKEPGFSVSKTWGDWLRIVASKAGGA